MKLTFASILFFLPFVVPVALQIILGIRSIKKKSRLNIWQITLINIGVLLIGNFILVMRIRPATAITNDGLVYVGLITLSLITLAIILCIMGVQYVLKRRRRNSHLGTSAPELETHNS